MSASSEAITDFAHLRLGHTYRVTYRAGGRVLTRTGQFEDDIWFAQTASHRTAWGKVIPVRRRFSVYPEEFVAAVEVADAPAPPAPVRPRRRRR